jgi:hypothetical protein
LLAIEYEYNDADAKRISTTPVLASTLLRIKMVTSRSMTTGTTTNPAQRLRSTMSAVRVSFTWMGNLEALHLACAFDIKVAERRRAPLHRFLDVRAGGMYHLP